MPLEVQLSKVGDGGRGDPIKRLDTTTFYACPRQDLDFQCHMSWSCLYLGERCFFILLILVELLSDHHCWNYFFIILWIQTMRVF